MREALLDNGSYTYANFIWILSTIKIKFGQIIVCCMTNISNMFLAECWRLETSSRLFYNFIKMAILQDLTIFNGWHLPFLIVPYSHFQKKETLEITSKLHQNSMSKWRGNSSMLTCRRNSDIDSTCWVCW